MRYFKTQVSLAAATAAVSEVADEAEPGDDDDDEEEDVAGRWWAAFGEPSSLLDRERPGVFGGCSGTGTADWTLCLDDDDDDDDEKRPQLCKTLYENRSMSLSVTSHNVATSAGLRE